MADYVYVKDEKTKRRYVKLAGLACILTGLIVLLYFFFPIISYRLFLAPVFAQTSIEVPVPKYLVIKQSNMVSLFSQGLSSLVTDYTDARNWYPKLFGANSVKVSSYLLSIPKLKIENAVVATNNYDLSKHLVQYAGTSTPPDRGTSVIFGHSTIPAWFDSKNYMAIFATLHTLKEGDQIIITVGNAKFTYKVFSITITNPEDTEMFSQAYDNSYITLVTCTPPGTVWKRLVVRASLDSLN